MRVEIKEKDLQKYNEINNELGEKRVKIGNLVIYYENEKNEFLDKIKILRIDLQNHLVNIAKSYKKWGKEIVDVDMEKGEIIYKDK